MNTEIGVPLQQTKIISNEDVTAVIHIAKTNIKIRLINIIFDDRNNISTKVSKKRKEKSIAFMIRSADKKDELKAEHVLTYQSTMKIPSNTKF